MDKRYYARVDGPLGPTDAAAFAASTDPQPPISIQPVPLQRLHVMSDQRYYLLRKEENGNKKASSGLELEILDEWTGKRRNVRSLSGGESFKAALSLALGLSDVIQNKKGGVQVDAIFIDEGFGTLDGDSLNKAMQIIHSLSAQGNKLVGIISHVEELKEQVDQKIEVLKDHTGSKIRL